MKLELSREWLFRMAEREAAAGADFSAGHASRDPIPELEAPESPDISQSIAFGLFISLLRRNTGLTVQQLSDAARVDVEELVEIEQDVHHQPDARSVYQLAEYFKLAKPKLMQLAGLTAQRDEYLHNEAMKFAARLGPVERLSPEEMAALESFVSVIGEKK